MTTLPSAFLTAPITHRALHDVTQGRAENSAAAIHAAIEAGYGIEIDVQMSKDGQAMVFHDYHLARLTDETGPVQQRTQKELSQITLKGGTDTIPTLDDVLKMVAGQVPLLIEIKDQDGRLGANVGRLEQAVATALQGYQGPVALMSFNPHSVQKMAGLCPDIPRGITSAAFDEAQWGLIPAGTRDRLRKIPDYDATGSCFISHEAIDLPRERVADLKRRGAHILCWTIRSAQAEAEARKIAQNVTFEGYQAALPG